MRILSPDVLRTLYLPAARSGLLQNHQLLAGALISRAPLVGIERPELSKVSGVTADVLSRIIQLERQPPRDLVAEIGAFIESRISGGDIDLEPHPDRAGLPAIFYEQQGRRFPLHASSSMVSEIAPIVLFLKYGVQSEDLVIIEEPEAHLHPANQRILAQAVVKLVRANVRVLLTTHSDYFLHQIGNFVMLRNSPALRTELGYDEDDYLSAEEVGVYAFRMGRDGSTTEAVPVSEAEGIPDEQFADVAERLCNEQAHIESAGSPG